MDLSKLCSCLNNTAQIDGTINEISQINSEMQSEQQIQSEMTGLIEVAVAYTGLSSDSIEVTVDSAKKTISATIKEIQFDSVEDFPEVGSENLIYVDKTQNMPYRFDKETGEYKSLGKDLTDEFKALEKEIEGVSKNSVNDIIVNNKSSVKIVDEKKQSEISIKIEQDTENNLLYYLSVNGERAGEINIPKDQFLKSVEYDPETDTLVFTWVTETGEQTTRIDMSDLVDVYSAGNGLELKDKIFSIKVDPTSSGMLTVSEDGIKLELEPATEKTFGVVRAWIEDGYLCISTNEWVAFTNTQTNGTLFVQGSKEAVQQGNTLIIN